MVSIVDNHAMASLDRTPAAKAKGGRHDRGQEADYRQERDQEAEVKKETIRDLDPKSKGKGIKGGAVTLHVTDSCFARTCIACR